MKPVSMYSPYGWKARIGLIVPSKNTNNETEFWHLAPPGVTVHTSRVLSVGQSSRQSFMDMAVALDRAADELATAEVDIVAYGCTTGSIVCPMPDLIARMQQRACAPALTTAAAVVAAMRALNMRRIAVATPYVAFLNESETAFFREYGFDVLCLKTLDLGHTEEERRAIGRVPAEAVYRLARSVDRDDADGVLISCTDLATVGILADLERELGKPVVSSNQACFWACLRMLRLPFVPPGRGSLFERCLAPIDASAWDLAWPRSADR